ncbi:Enzymatic polyprotein [Dictyocoela muelleri]|nr:Enzymatic polyprotein [Dictyocoela muelleri]
MTKKRLKKLLGFINWSRPYIRNLLTYFYQFYMKFKQRKLEWNSDDKMKLTEILKMIYERPLLSFPDFNKDFSMFCDASKTGIISALYQGNKVIGFFSSIYKGAEKNYSITEK